jgi:NADH-quinone oxidoreductase subunit I
MTDVYEFSQYSADKLILHKEDLMELGRYYLEREKKRGRE